MYYTYVIQGEKDKCFYTGFTRDLRNRLNEHRKNPSCASCHALIDPLGFALENIYTTLEEVDTFARAMEEMAIMAK